MRRLTLGFCTALLASLALASMAAAQEGPRFRLGFEELSGVIPEVAGQALENEHHNTANGDSLQRTTTGLMVWRKADNWTAFTDGATTWINGPLGLQSRPNEVLFGWETRGRGEEAAASSPGGQSVLDSHLLVTWYGNPRTGLMGILGRYSGDDLAGRLRSQAEAYAPHTDKVVLPAYELVTVVATAGPGADGMWRRRETPDVIDSMLEQARAQGFRLILDVQVGHSSVAEELEYLRPWLEDPDVYLALDPEFDMAAGQAPGQMLGHTLASDVNHAIGVLEEIVTSRGLPPKVLLVHQFVQSMLPDKGKIGDSPVVDVVLVMDGFGSQAVKLGTYNAVMGQPLEYPGIKLFYDHDSGLFTPEQLMGLDPVPALVSYQ